MAFFQPPHAFEQRVPDVRERQAELIRLQFFETVVDRGEGSCPSRCLFRKYTASSCGLSSCRRKPASSRRGRGDWMPAYAGMTFYWRWTYEMNI
jgi:hypothetical protein